MSESQRYGPITARATSDYETFQRAWQEKWRGEIANNPEYYLIFRSLFSDGYLLGLKVGRGEYRPEIPDRGVTMGKEA
jgi:hypothetical protein